ncbi:MAG: DinB family protein [Ginsengibacter sp.]
MDRTGAIGALLDIYETAIADLKNVIKDISNEDLTVITDAETLDDNCRSLQDMLTHVVYAGFGYATLIKNVKGDNLIRPTKVYHTAVSNYMEDIVNVFVCTENVLGHFTDKDIEEHDNALKIKSGWGQSYDVEQMMEHAIVHIFRHKRQIENIRRNQLIKA